MGPTVARLTGEASSRRNQGLQVGGLDLLDLLDQLWRGERPPVDQHLAGELLGAGARAFEPCQKPHLELCLDPGDLILAEACLGGLEQLLADHRDQLMRPVGSAGGVDREHAAIGKAAGEGVDRVAKPAPLAHLLEQARGHAAAERAGTDLGGEIIGVAIGRRLEGEHEMGLLEGLVASA